jgi:hypothetical protein
MSVNQKQKGGTYERKVAKELAFWMFNDQDFLKRHATSGMDKSVWCGYITPMKQLPDNPWKRHFPFLIETKTGYVQFSPTFWKYNQINIWFKKAYQEGLINNQNIIFLICQFKNKSQLLITNHMIDVNILLFNVVIPIEINGIIHYGYVYILKHLLEKNFYELFNLEELNYGKDRNLYENHS